MAAARESVCQRMKDEIIPHQRERERKASEAPKMSNSNSENSGGSTLALSSSLFHFAQMKCCARARLVRCIYCMAAPRPAARVGFAAVSVRKVNRLLADFHLHRNLHLTGFATKETRPLQWLSKTFIFLIVLIFAWTLIMKISFSTSSASRGNCRYFFETLDWIDHIPSIVMIFVNSSFCPALMISLAYFSLVVNIFSIFLVVSKSLKLL